MKRWFLILTIASVLLAPAAAQEAGHAANIDVTVQRVHRDGRTFYDVNAKGFARATPPVVWKVLTDYERLPKFVPNLQSTKLLSRNAQETIIEQNGQAGFLFITQSIHLVLRVVEQPISVIDIVLLSGDMKHYVSHWEIAIAQQGASSGTLITYSGEPPVPDYLSCVFHEVKVF